MKRIGMNGTKNETVRFSMKPNPVFYALEVTWQMLLVFTALGGILLVFSPVVLLTTYFLVGLAIFIVAFVTARHLMFIVTDKRAIVRFSSSVKTTDELSIAIETVKRIEITSYGAAYGSVYLTHEEPSPRENSRGKPDDPQPRPIRRAFVPIERAASIWILLSKWPRLFGFYGFKGFNEFANIISEQQNSVPNVRGDHDAR
jgi:hypothetical protein